MYIKTPKRYRGVQRRTGFSCQRFLLSLILLVLIFVGIGIYQNRTMFQPQVNTITGTLIAQVDSWQATQFAPTPTPAPDPSVNLRQGNEEWRAGRISESVSYYSQVTGALPNDSLLHSRLAVGYLTRGRTELALDYAERAVTADPFSSDAWATRAFIFAWEGQYAFGIASAEQALDLDPNNIRAIAFRGYAYWGAGQLTRAQASVEEALALDPDRYEAYWVRGIINENSVFDFEAALEDYEVAYDLALEQDPPMAGIIAAGIARIEAAVFGDSQRAVEVLERVRSFDRENTTVLYWLGYTYYTIRGEYGQAETPLDDCVEQDNDDYLCWYLLGRTRDKLENQEGALEAFRSAIDSGSPYARVWWWAAEMERVLGNCPEATPFLEEGYRMVIPGDLPAGDEGDADLIGSFEERMLLCGVTIPNSNNIVPTIEPTDAVGDA